MMETIRAIGRNNPTASTPPRYPSPQGEPRNDHGDRQNDDYHPRYLCRQPPRQGALSPDNHPLPEHPFVALGVYGHHAQKMGAPVQPGGRDGALEPDVRARGVGRVHLAYVRAAALHGNRGRRDAVDFHANLRAGGVVQGPSAHGDRGAGGVGEDGIASRLIQQSEGRTRRERRLERGLHCIERPQREVRDAAHDRARGRARRPPVHARCGSRALSTRCRASPGSCSAPWSMPSPTP